MDYWFDLFSATTKFVIHYGIQLKQQNNLRNKSSEKSDKDE